MKSLSDKINSLFQNIVVILFDGVNILFLQSSIPKNQMNFKDFVKITFIFFFSTEFLYKETLEQNFYFWNLTIVIDNGTFIVILIQISEEEQTLVVPSLTTRKKNSRGY